MNQTPADILSLTSEAALLLQHGRISFANSAARGLLGEDCVGKTTRSVLGVDLAGSQAPSFVANIPLGGRSCVARVTRIGAGQLVFLNCPDVEPALVNDPFLYELRSGLMSISLAADQLREQAERAGAEAALANVRSITRSYFRLLRMMANAALILNASKEALPVSFAPMSLTELCRSVLELSEHFLPGLSCRADLREDISVVADPVLVKQLLLNLLANCLTHAGTDCHISVSLSASAGSVVLSVSDDGCGIEPEQLHTVFDRYRHPFRAVSMNSGPGLGLTVSRLITTVHHGALLLESRPGQGTTVRASIARDLSPSVTLGAPQTDGSQLVRDVLVGLAAVLPDDCYTEKYLD